MSSFCVLYSYHHRLPVQHFLSVARIIYSVLGIAGPAWNSLDSPDWSWRGCQAMAENVDPNKTLRFADSPAGPSGLPPKTPGTSTSKKRKRSAELDGMIRDRALRAKVGADGSPAVRPSLSVLRVISRETQVVLLHCFLLQRLLESNDTAKCHITGKCMMTS